MTGNGFFIADAVRDWLVDKSNPSVRFFALTRLMDRPSSDPDVKAAARDIMQSMTVRAILDAQAPEGYWGAPERFYTAKYQGTAWNLLILAELGADRKNEHIQKACRFILDHAQHRQSGGFSYKGGKKAPGGLASGVIPCLTGNMAWVLLRFGLASDPRVQKAIGWIAAYQRFDDGIDNPPGGWPYDGFEMCWGGHTCHMGVVKTLKALAEIPESQRTPDVRKTIEKGAEFMLIHHIFKRSHNLDKVSKPGWKKFGFPLMYQTDALEILNLLLTLGYRDTRMKAARDLVLEKRKKDGTWAHGSTYPYKFMVPIPDKNKWITLNALWALRRFPETG